MLKIIGKIGMIFPVQKKFTGRGVSSPLFHSPVKFFNAALPLPISLILLFIYFLSGIFFFLILIYAYIFMKGQDQKIYA